MNITEEEEFKIREQLKAAKEAVDAQGELIKKLKENNATKEEINQAVDKLKGLKKTVDKTAKQLRPADKLTIDRNAFDQLLARRSFVNPAFEIYGGVRGLYDFGPAGCAIKANVLNEWRKQFIIEECLLEVDTTCLTPKPVLVASGHVEKFFDYVVKDEKKNTYHRADHLLEDAIDDILEKTGGTISEEEKMRLLKIRGSADSLSCEELGAQLKAFNVKAPETGNDLSDPFPRNLMFETSIGPTGDQPGFLRPETAQGMFVNFPRLLEFNGRNLPFGAATIGLAFRNEISPASGLIRVREFPLAEIEYFCFPDQKNHPKFYLIKDVVLTLFSKENQVGSMRLIKITAEEAVNSKTIANQTLAYFMVKTLKFFESIGIRTEDCLRFRQHLTSEMAHYACDCWDAEVLTSHGWIECVGHADRACYDLSQHAKATGEKMSAPRMLKESKEVDIYVPKINKQYIGKTFKKDGGNLIKYLEKMEDEDRESLNNELEKNGKSVVKLEGVEFEINKEIVSFTKTKKKIVLENIVPSVIEPAYGIGRIIYSVMEHAYYCRSDGIRHVMKLAPCVAPVKAVILPLQNEEKFVPLTHSISKELLTNGISTKIDEVAVTIGRRYARNDEVGIPFGVTIDYQTLEDSTVTLRERDSTNQIRVPIKDLADLLTKLTHNRTSFDDLRKIYPNFDELSVEEREEKKKEKQSTK